MNLIWYYSMHSLIKHSLIKAWNIDYTLVNKKVHVNIDCWIVTKIRVDWGTVINKEYLETISSKQFFGGKVSTNLYSQPAYLL